MKWIVDCKGGRFPVEADDQWDAWEQVIKTNPERIGLVVSARPFGSPEEDRVAIRGVDLAFRYGQYEVAKRLDELAVSEGLPSVWASLIASVAEQEGSDAE